MHEFKRRDDVLIGYLFLFRKGGGGGGGLGGGRGTMHLVAHRRTLRSGVTRRL